MHCQHCGNKIEEAEKFCSKCGYSVATKAREDSHHVLAEDKWWIRLSKVIYIALYIPLLLIIPLVWSENTPYYSSYSNQYYGSYGEAFWYSLLTLIIYLFVIRLIKITFLYIVSGQKPRWKKEFRKLF